jgi:acyl carrier protein
MRQADASLHDVLYGIVAGALGSYHQRQGRMVDSLRVIIPMAIPPTSWKGGLGNHLVLSALTLPLSELDARKRLRLVGDLFRRMKEDGTIGAYEFAAAVMDRFVPRWFHRRLWEAMIGRTNLVCTILPGPENVRYLGGARITGIYGVPAPVIGHGAAVAFVTYAGRICGSITTDLGVVPRSQELVECFDASYRQLLKDVTGETMSVHPLLGHPISLPDEDLVFEGSIHAGVGAHNRDAPRIVDYEKCPVGAPLEVLFAAGAIAQCGRSVTDMQCAAESVRSARDHRIELSSPLVLRDVNWQSHLAVSRCRVITIQTVVVKRGSSCRIQVSGLQEDESWRCLIVGQVEFGEAIPATEDACISEIRERCRRPVPICEFPKGFPDLEIVGICDSPLPCQLWRGESESLGMVEVPDAMRNGGYLFHPALLEASLQIGAMAFPDGLRERAARIKGVNSIHIDRRPGARVWIHSKFEYHRGRGTASVQWLTPEGQSIAWFQGLQWSPSEESPLEEHFGVDSNLGERIRHTPSDQRWELVSLHVRTQVADVLGWSWAEQIRVRDRFVDLGIDSMMAMELGLRLEQSTGLPLPHTLIFDYPTVEALTEYLLARTGIGVEAIAEPANLDEIPELSESDLAEMLLKELT